MHLWCRGGVPTRVSARICAWVRELYAVPQDGAVFVTELCCADAGCAAVETVVLIASGVDETLKPKSRTRRAAVRQEHDRDVERGNADS